MPSKRESDINLYWARCADLHSGSSKISRIIQSVMFRVNVSSVKSRKLIKLDMSRIAHAFVNYNPISIDPNQKVVWNCITSPYSLVDRFIIRKYLLMSNLVQNVAQLICDEDVTETRQTEKLVSCLIRMSHLKTWINLKWYFTTMRTEHQKERYH